MQQIALLCEKQHMTLGRALKDGGRLVHSKLRLSNTKMCVVSSPVGQHIEMVSLSGATVCGADSVSPPTSLEVPSLSLPPPVSPVPAVVFSCLHILHR